MELDVSADEARDIANVVNPIIIDVSRTDTWLGDSSCGDGKSPPVSCVHSSPHRNNALSTELK